MNITKSDNLNIKESELRKEKRDIRLVFFVPFFQPLPRDTIHQYQAMY